MYVITEKGRDRIFVRNKQEGVTALCKIIDTSSADADEVLRKVELFGLSVEETAIVYACFKKNALNHNVISFEGKKKRQLFNEIGREVA